MASHKVVCWDCGCDVDDPFVNTCPRCGGLLTVRMDLEPVKEMKPEDLRKEPIGVWRYAPFLPVDYAKRVSIKEGGTPLYRTDALAAECGIGEMHVKYEGANPTGSFKDRGMTVGVSHAVELGAKVVGCTLPMAAEKIGIDPAVMASPFITTIVDALSLLIYFFIATRLLGI